MGNMKAPLPQCAAMVRVQNILSGKWKITILWYIAEYEVQRFGELRRRLGDKKFHPYFERHEKMERHAFNVMPGSPCLSRGITVEMG